MKLIIDIPEEAYDFIKRTGYHTQSLYEAIKNSTPLNDELKEIKQDISLLKDHVQTDAHTITAYTWKGMQDKVLDIIDSHIKEYTSETDN